MVCLYISLWLSVHPTLQAELGLQQTAGIHGSGEGELQTLEPALVPGQFFAFERLTCLARLRAFPCLCPSPFQFLAFYEWCQPLTARRLLHFFAFECQTWLARLRVSPSCGCPFPRARPSRRSAAGSPPCSRRERGGTRGPAKGTQSGFVTRTPLNTKKCVKHI